MVSDGRRSRQEFDDGYFTEDDLKVLKRMLPASFMPEARKKTRKDFFNHVRCNLTSGPRVVGPLKQALYNLGLSKRDIPLKKAPLKPEKKAVDLGVGKLSRRVDY